MHQLKTENTKLGHYKCFQWKIVQNNFTSHTELRTVQWEFIQFRTTGNGCFYSLDQTHISSEDLGFIHTARVREPNTPSFCEGGESTHPDRLG